MSTMLMGFPGGSGSGLYDPSKRKAKTFSFPAKDGREVPVIIAANDLLLEPDDVGRFSEAFLEWLDRHGIADILETYIAESSSIKREFQEALDATETPARASEVIKQANKSKSEKGKSPMNALVEESSPIVADPIPKGSLFSFSKLMSRRISSKTVFIFPDGKFETESISRMRTAASLYLRSATEGGLFEHIYEFAPVKNHVGESLKN